MLEYLTPGPLRIARPDPARASVPRMGSSQSGMHGLVQASVATAPLTSVSLGISGQFSGSGRRPRVVRVRWLRDLQISAPRRKRHLPPACQPASMSGVLLTSRRVPAWPRHRSGHSSFPRRCPAEHNRIKPGGQASEDSECCQSLHDTGPDQPSVATRDRHCHPSSWETNKPQTQVRKWGQRT